MKTFDQDRPKIENKYHLQNEPFDPYHRMAYHGYAFEEDTGKTDTEILEGLAHLEKELSSLPHPIAKAKAIAYVLEHTRIDVNESDYFVGLYSVNRLANCVTLQKWEQALNQTVLRETRKEMDDLIASGSADIWPDFDHVVPDWQSVLSLGFAGLRRRAADYRAKHAADGTLNEEMDAHFTGIDIEYGAILALIDRLYRLAKQKTHAKAEKVATCLLHLKEGAPTDFYEALQTIYLYFMISECFDSYQVRSLGNGLDASLYPFWQKDLQENLQKEEDLKELLAYFLFQWSAIGNYWGQPFYLGGTNADGSSRYNDLSRAILDVYDALGIYNPKIQLKIGKTTPDDILFHAFDMVRRGQNSFAFCCEQGMQKAVMRYGASAEEARDFDIRGCYETGVRANEVSSGTGYVNAPKAIEYVLTNGYEKRLGRDYGEKTGEINTFSTFEDFYKATLVQWGAIIEKVIACANEYEKYFFVINPSLTYSATIEYSLNQGKDAYQNGVKFNQSTVLNCGFATLVDSVMAVKYLVYETKKVTLQELKEALKADWVGYEALHTMAKKCPYKYGNHQALTDAYAAEMSHFFTHRVNHRKNARGGTYKAILHSAMQFVWQGQKTMATPDGRRSGEETSKNASPSVGMDRNGVTALIQSVLQIEPSAYLEGTCVDILLHPSAVAGEEGKKVMKALLMAYYEKDGMAMQFNVFQSDTLRNAQRNPEQYRNLQVRVCGWNVLWNDLSPAEQNAYIARAQSME